MSSYLDVSTPSTNKKTSKSTQAIQPMQLNALVNGRIKDHLPPQSCGAYRSSQIENDNKD